MQPWAGAVEIPTGILLLALAFFVLGPPCAVSLAATAVHVVRRKPGEERRGGRFFLQWMAVSTVVWVVLFYLLSGPE